MPSGMTTGGSGKEQVNAGEARRQEALSRILASMQGWFGDYVRGELMGGAQQAAQPGLIPGSAPGGGFMPPGLNQNAIPGGGFMPPGAGPIPGSIPGGGFMGAGLNQNAIPGGGYMPPMPPPGGLGRSTGNSILDLLEMIGGQGR